MPAGFLLDLEGTLYQGNTLLPGARELLARLEAAGIPFGFVSNTTSRSSAMLVSHLATLGITTRAEQFTTAPVAAGRLARERGWNRVTPFLPSAALIDLAPLTLVGGAADMQDGSERTGPAAEAIIVGDMGARWSFTLLQEAFTCLRQGAGFITCSRDRYYRQLQGLVLDAGPFVAALEYATDTTALLAGKPSPAIFEAALAALGVPTEARHDVVMIGDDLRTDVGGAKDAGLTAWAVRTGKYALEHAEQIGVVPDRILTDLRDVLADGLA